MAVSIGTMQLTLSITIMQVPTSVAIMQVLRFCCNYAGGTSGYNYAGGSFCCNYAVAIAMLQFIFLSLTDTHFS